MASAYMNSIKANFSPSKKMEKKGKIGSTTTPTRKTDSHKLMLGSK